MNKTLYELEPQVLAVIGKIEETRRVAQMNGLVYTPGTISVDPSAPAPQQP